MQQLLRFSTSLVSLSPFVVRATTVTQGQLWGQTDLKLWSISRRAVDGSVSEEFMEVTQKTRLPRIRMSREGNLNENESGECKM